MEDTSYTTMDVISDKLSATKQTLECTAKKLREKGKN